MANSDKDILITPNSGSSTVDPKIEYVGADSSANDTITVETQFDGSKATLSFEGSAGQLFSISNDLSGTIFAVNDVSGIPSIEVDSDGEIRLAEFSGNVGIGTSTPTELLHVDGRIKANNLTLSSLSAQNSEATAVMIDGSGIIGTRELGSNAFNSTSYLTGNQTITLSGDVSGSGTTSISVTVADDSHNHIISNVDGLQSALDGKLSTTGTAANSQLLDSLDSTAFLRSDATDTATGSITFSGDTTFTGSIGNSTTTLDSVKIGVSSGGDPQIQLTGNGVNAHIDFSNTSGQDYDVRIINNASNQLDFQGVAGTGLKSAGNTVWHAGNDGSGSGLDADTLDGQHASAFLTGNQTITLSGDVSGSGTTSIAVTIADDSHNHVISNVDGLQTALAGKLAQGSFSAGYTGDMDSLTGFRVIRSTSGSNRAFTNHHNVLQLPNTSASAYNAQIAFETGSVADGGIKFRNVAGGSYSSWYRLYSEAHKPTYSELGTMAYSNLTGTPTIPSLSGYATETYVNTQVSNLVDSAPGTLDTLNELAAALGDDANFSTTVTNSIATKLPLAGGTLTGSLRAQADLNYFGLASGNNEGEIIINTGQAGSPQIGFTEHGDASWAIGIDDADNSFKMHGTANSTIPTINNLAIPLFEITTTAGTAYLNNSRIFTDAYHPNADKWTTARTLSLTGAVTGSVSWDGSGNASIATTATADPTLTLSGDASGSATFTNLGNATLSVTIADDSHNHVISNVDGLQTALDGKLSTSGTAANSQLLDSLDSTAFLRSNADDTMSEKLTFSQSGSTEFMETPGTVKWHSNGAGFLILKGLGQLRFEDEQNWDYNSWGGLKFDSSADIMYIGGPAASQFTSNANPPSIDIDFVGLNASGLKKDGNVVWHAGNDGSGSGLDADLLDGQHASAFLTGNQTITLTGDVSGSGTTSIAVTIADDSHNHVISNVDGLQTALDAKAPLASPTFTTKITTPAIHNTGKISILNGSAAQGIRVNSIYAGTSYAADGSASGMIDTLNGYRVQGAQVINSSGNWVGGGNISEFTNNSGFITSSDSSITNKLPLAGGTMSGNIAMGGNDVLGASQITLNANPTGTSYGGTSSATPANMISQVVGANDGWRLYGEGASNDVKMIFEVIDDNETGDTWVFRNKKTYSPYTSTEDFKITGEGDIYARRNGYVNGSSRIFADNYHPNADTLTSARTISLTGAVTGSVSFNGSSNVSMATTATADPTLTLSGDASGSATFTNLGNATLSVTVADNSHVHDTWNLNAAASSQNIDTAYANKFWTQDRGTETNLGTYPAQYTFATNLGGGRSQGIQLASSFGTGVDMWFRTGTDNTNSENGANTWKNWRKLYHVDYHPEADKWTNARTITLAGDATGSVSFNGSVDKTLTVTVADDSHNHVISNVDGLQTALDAKLPLAGGTMTGTLNMGGNAFTGNNFNISGVNQISLNDPGEGIVFGSNCNLYLLDDAADNILRLDAPGGFRLHNGPLSIGTTTVIDSSRNLTNIGTIASGVITATNSGNAIVAKYNASNYSALRYDGVDTIAGGDGVYKRGGSEKLRLKTSGVDVTGTMTASADVVAYSDERLKSNIQTLDGKKALQMRGVSFEKDGVQSSGVIAQEIEKIAPELVHTSDDEMKTKSVAYGNLVGYLIEAVKEQQEQINKLTDRINDLAKGE